MFKSTQTMTINLRIKSNILSQRRVYWIQIGISLTLIPRIIAKVDTVVKMQSAPLQKNVFASPVTLPQVILDPLALILLLDAFWILAFPTHVEILPPAFLELGLNLIAFVKVSS